MANQTRKRVKSHTKPAKKPTSRAIPTFRDRDTGVIVERTLKHEGEAVRTFYGSIPPPVVVGIEATGSMGWFLRLMEELAIECRVGHPVAIRKAEALAQKGFAKARVAAARKLGIRLWIMLRDQIDYAEFCRRGLARQS